MWLTLGEIGLVDIEIRKVPPRARRELQPHSTLSIDINTLQRLADRIE